VTVAGNPDLAIVGAGAAGLAAARTALELGLCPLVLEAKDRIGGRAFTDTATLGVPWERGANWLHNADDNFFRAYADRHGFAYEPQRPTRRTWCQGWADAALIETFHEYEARAFEAVEQAGLAGRDVAAAEVIPPHPCFRPALDAWFAALNGVEPARSSTVDYARTADGRNLRLENGYGALVAHYGRGLPVRLRAEVRRIRRAGAEIVLETPQGDVRARCALVTVSTNVLAAEKIAFDPPLPLEKREAIAAVPTGEADKVAIAFDRNVFGEDGPFHLGFHHASVGFIPFEIRPFGRDLAIGHFGGRFALEMAAAGSKAAIALVLDALAEAFGATIRSHVRAAAATSWCTDPHVLSGYSCALPGKAHLRPMLAEPLGDRLLFAGEACSLDAYGTAHGAHTTGVAGAKRAAEALGVEKRPRPAAR
jgi:monoamine oxidase